MASLSINQRGALLSVLMLVVGLLFWEAAIPEQQLATEMTEYERLMGGGAPRAAIPPPSDIFAKAWEELSNPFYDAGPNDKGIGIQIGYSIYRVLSGYFLAALVAIPLGFLIGMSPVAYKALNPFIQVLRPDLAAGVDAARALRDPRQRGLGDLRDLHLLDLAHAAEHRLRRGERPAGLGERRPHA
jgi:nitrate/nitrite transport system permease protein